MRNEIFIILSENQISVSVFDKEKKKSVHNMIYELKNNLSDNIQLENNLNHQQIWKTTLFYYTNEMCQLFHLQI